MHDSKIFRTFAGDFNYGDIATSREVVDSVTLDTMAVRKINIDDSEISVIFGLHDEDYICLTDMVKAGDNSDRIQDSTLNITCPVCGYAKEKALKEHKKSLIRCPKCNHVFFWDASVNKMTKLKMKLALFFIDLACRCR